MPVKAAAAVASEEVERLHSARRSALEAVETLRVRCANAELNLRKTSLEVAAAKQNAAAAEAAQQALPESCRLAPLQVQTCCPTALSCTTCDDMCTLGHTASVTSCFIANKTPALSIQEVFWLPAYTGAGRALS